MTTPWTGLALDAPESGAPCVVDISCGSCANCLAGARLWCSDPRQDGAVLVRAAAGQARAALAALLLADSVRAAELEGDEVVLVIGAREAVAAAELVRRLHNGPVIAATDPRDAEVRARLGTLRPSGRADVVATATDDRAAVRAVARGGDVCLAGQDALATSVTELVQREVRVVGPRDVARLVSAIGRASAESVLAQI